MSNPLSGVRLIPDTLIGTPGFFRTGKDDRGHWWMVDPDGRPFLFKGVTSVNRSGRAGGRRAVPGPYTEAVSGRYGQDAAPWVRSVLDRLRHWNFNALGAWAEESLFDQGFPYTDIMECVLDGPQVARHGVRLPDVFDPVWENVLEEKARTLCAPRRGKRDFIGYFTDNEMGWAAPQEEEAWGGMALSHKGVRIFLLQHCLSLDPDRPAFQEAWKFVLARHGTVSAAGKAWGLELREQADVRTLSEANQPIVAEAYREDLDAWVRVFARRYFQKTAEAIRRHDPDHLVLGCRFGGPPGPAVLAECRRPWVDVLSANNYQENFYGRVDIYYRGTDGQVPIMNGEFAWSSGHFTEPAEGEPADMEMLARMHKRGRPSLERAFLHPGLVGYTWYRWVDQPSHRVPNNYGLVSVTDATHPHHTELLTEINARLVGIKAGVIDPADDPKTGQLLILQKRA